MTLMSTPACNKLIAVECRMVCGETCRFARSGKTLLAACTAKANLSVTLLRDIRWPLRFGSKGDVAWICGLARSQARTALTVECHNGTLRCLRPLPWRWTH